MDKRMVILRGISGAGKTTEARRIVREHASDDTVTCSADDAFTRPDGSYHFDVSALAAAHGACFCKAIEACQAQTELVVVDNTSLSAAEIAPYALLGQAHGYAVEIVTLRVDPLVAVARATHGVGAERIVTMARVLDEETARLAPWWTHRVVDVGAESACAASK